MEEQHKDILRKHRVFLRREISADRLASDLYAAEIFDEEDVDEVNAATTRQQRAERLLDILTHRGPDAFVCFYQLLQKTCRHVAEKILTPYSGILTCNTHICIYFSCEKNEVIKLIHVHCSLLCTVK